MGRALGLLPQTPPHGSQLLRPLLLGVLLKGRWGWHEHASIWQHHQHACRYTMLLLNLHAKEAKMGIIRKRQSKACIDQRIWVVAENQIELCIVH